jgi:hypothetical protein
MGENYRFFLFIKREEIDEVLNSPDHNNRGD